jgi:drug/metabolite transporter (DMT)-like permease
MRLVLVMVAWGSAFAGSKVGVDAVAPQIAAAIRFLGGGLILLAVLPFTGKARLRPRDIAVAGGLGLVGVFGYNMALFAGLTLAPAADASVLIPTMSPVCTTVVMAIVSRSRLRSRTVAGLVCALAGAAAFLLGIPHSLAGGARLLGDLVYVAGALCWSVYTMCGAPVLRRLPTLTVTAYATVAGGLVLAVSALPVVGGVDWAGLTTGFWLDQAYLVLVPTALAYPLFYQGVQRLGAARAASMMFLVPVFGVTLSVTLLHERITVVQVLGAVLLLAGAWLATHQPKAASAIEVASLAPATMDSQQNDNHAATASGSPVPKAAAADA